MVPVKIKTNLLYKSEFGRAQNLKELTEIATQINININKLK